MAHYAPAIHSFADDASWGAAHVAALSPAGPLVGPVRVHSDAGAGKWLFRKQAEVDYPAILDINAIGPLRTMRALPGVQDPQSITRSWPVMLFAASDNRNTTALAMSSGWLMRLSED